MISLQATAREPAEPGQAPAASICFHCGLPIARSARWPVEIDGVQRLTCCPGCQAVARSIILSGCADYYRNRLDYAATADAAKLLPPELALVDARIDQPALPDSADVTRTAKFSVDDIRCAACVWLIERRLAQLDGVRRAEMNVASSQLEMTWDSRRCKVSDIIRTLRSIGYAAYPFDATQHGERLGRAAQKLFRRLFIAGLAMMQVMMYAVPVYLADAGSMDPTMHALMRWAGLLLTLPAVCYSAQPFFLGSWHDLKNRMPGMDVPVTLGIVVAFGASVIATVRGHGAVYFDSITMFIFLLLCSRYLELGARRKAAAALDRLHQSLPSSVLRIDNFPLDRTPLMLAASELRCGDVILVRAGDAVAADGEVLEGASEIDQSLLTGESRALTVGVGSRVPGGAVNRSHPLILKVVKQPGDSSLSVLTQLADQAARGKPHMAQWADRIATWFVVALLLFAVTVFAYWYRVDPRRAWEIAIAVLVVSCPCALSLATPTVLAAATNRLLRQGVLIKQTHVLETLQRASHIVFDKTGTLSAGKPCLQQMHLFGALPQAQCLAIAAALAAGSSHPLSAALCEAARARPTETWQARNLRQVAGSGLEGEVNGCRYRLGSAAFVGELAGLGEVPPGAVDTSSVYLASVGQCLARFDLVDRLRPEAQAAVDYFHIQGKRVVLLSGDRNEIVQRVADRLGIVVARGDCLPQQKLNYVQELQRQGAVVAMVGDGVNDAAVLGAADIAIAMGGAAALAQMHADAVLLADSLSGLIVLDATAHKTVRVVRQNLAWASVYNLIAIPAAALGLLNPWMSGIGMSASSALVVLNALRLQRMTNPLRSR